MLSKKPMSFSEMLGVLGVSSSFLTYHLENLGELVGKIDDGKYKLSSFGEAAIATMTKVEDIPTSAPQQSPEHPETRSQKWSGPLGIIARRFKSSETEPRKVVRRSVAIALGIMCIILVAGIGGAMIYDTMTINNKNNEVNSQKIAINQLNATIVEQNDTISQLSTDLTNLQNQINQLIANLFQESTVIAQNYSVASAPNSSTVIVSNNTVLPNNVPVLCNGISVLVTNGLQSYYIDHVDINHAGYIVVVVDSPDSVVELKYSSNGVNYSSTVYFEGPNGSAYFPVLPTSTLEIRVGNTNPTVYLNETTINVETGIGIASNTVYIILSYIETVTITYYY